MQVHRGSLLYESLYTHRDKSKPTENLISNLPLIYCLTGLFWQVIVLSSRGENAHLLLDFTLQWAASVPVKMSEISTNGSFKHCCLTEPTADLKGGFSVFLIKRSVSVFTADIKGKAPPNAWSLSFNTSRCIDMWKRLTQLQRFELRQMGRSAELVKDVIIPLFIRLQ